MAPNDWGGIRFAAGGSGSVLNIVSVRYGGNYWQDVVEVEVNTTAISLGDELSTPPTPPSA